MGKRWGNWGEGWRLENSCGTKIDKESGIFTFIAHSSISLCLKSVQLISLNVLFNKSQLLQPVWATLRCWSNFKNAWLLSWNSFFLLSGTVSSVCIKRVCVCVSVCTARGGLWNQPESYMSCVLLWLAERPLIHQRTRGEDLEWKKRRRKKML